MPEKQGVLTREDILWWLDHKPPLIAEAINLEEQLQPHGIDLTVREIAVFSSPGYLAENNQGRKLSDTAPIPFECASGVYLAPGPYLVTFNEIVSLPDCIMALGRPRSTLNRCGVSIHSAVWDAGYSGRSQSMLTVYNTHGFTLCKNARVMQLVFFYTTRSVQQGYCGKFQSENI